MTIPPGYPLEEHSGVLVKEVKVCVSLALTRFHAPWDSLKLTTSWTTEAAFTGIDCHRDIKGVPKSVCGCGVSGLCEDATAKRLTLWELSLNNQVGDREPMTYASSTFFNDCLNGCRSSGKVTTANQRYYISNRVQASGYQGRCCDITYALMDSLSFSLNVTYQTWYRKRIEIFKQLIIVFVYGPRAARSDLDGGNVQDSPRTYLWRRVPSRRWYSRLLV